MINFRIEKRLGKNTGKTIVAMDEVGRGPIAGPVAVGAVLLDSSFYAKIKKKDQWWKLVDDSKKLSPKSRKKLFNSIKKNLTFEVGMASQNIIDKYGIIKAIRLAAKRALRNLKAKPEIILVDGYRKFVGSKNCSERTIVKGDSRIWGIACASIAAKVIRDDYMRKASELFPQYHFHRHKGYGTALHIKCLKRYGPCSLHRFSFAPVKNRGFRKSSFQTKRGNASN